MTVTKENPTLLVMSGIGVQPYSARGLKQTLTPIQQAASLRRTVNGVLHDLSLPQFRRYASTISGADQAPPPLDARWPGFLVVVDCISELSYPLGGAPAKTPVPGSTRVDGGFSLYRPRLTMRVMGFSMDTDEWSAGVGWSMQLEEA